MRKWETLEDHYLVNDQYLRLKSQVCETSEGHRIEPYYVFEYNDWVNCVVISSNNEVILLRNYRQGVQENVIEIIGGGIEEGESPKEAIKRELMEEIGYSSGVIQQTGVCYANPANHTNKVYSFIAYGVDMNEQQNTEVGETFEIEIYSFSNFLDMLEGNSNNGIMQSLHITSAYFAQNFILSSEINELNSLKYEILNRKTS